MAGRGRTSSQKRRKEQNRLEKRQMKAERKEKLKADHASGGEAPEMEDVPLSGPIPLEFDPDLDRGLTPDLEAELNLANRTASRS